MKYQLSKLNDGRLFHKLTEERKAWHIWQFLLVVGTITVPSSPAGIRCTYVNVDGSKD